MPNEPLCFIIVIPRAFGSGHRAAEMEIDA